MKTTPFANTDQGIDELQQDLDNWMQHYNQERTHSGKYCYGKTPMVTFLDAVSLAKEKMIGDTLQTEATVH